ncbi:RAB11-binding protein RELCH homolog isoform X2 [Watersipora subatra]
MAYTPANPFLDDDGDFALSESTSPKISVVDERVTSNNSPVGDRMHYDDISRQLILDGFILTALELHTELQEIGKPVTFLKDHFSNPGNFERMKPPDVQSTSPPVSLQRSGSIQTFDSLDWARYSDDGDRQAEDRVAGLEFELRKAQDTIKSLRKALTIATENSSNSGVTNEKSNTRNESAESADAIKPHQRRAINFLVNEYLLLHDYKLTSVTFAEENENQDFEHWDDVGLNISKPPDLLHLYLDFGKHSAPVVDICEVATGDNFYAPEIEALEKQLQMLREQLEVGREEFTSLRMTNESLTTDIEILKLENSSLTDKIEEQRLTIVEHNQQLPPNDDKRHKTDVPDGPEVPRVHSPHQLYSYQPVDRTIPTPFLNSILSMSYHIPSDNRIAQQVSKIDGNSSDTIVDMIAQCLPHIVPNVLLAKREELLPLILCAANLHHSVKARDSMLSTLFNLIKKPDRLQREMILTGCIMFAQYNGPGRVEEELLPQCWEQINDKHTERRLLVVNACCALIPYMSSSMRASLLLSMLQQMLLDERVSEIRAAVVRSLGILVCFIDDVDKFSQILALYSRHILTDSSPDVQEEALKVLLPSLALWAAHINRMANISELLLAALQNSLTEPNEENEIKVIPDSFLPAVKHLHQLINFQFISMLYSGPYNDNSYSSEDEISMDNHGAEDLTSLFTLVENVTEYRHLWKLFIEYTSEEWYKTWPEFELLVYTTFSQLSMLALSIQPDEYRVISSLVQYVKAVCALLGKRITTDKVEPKFNELFKYEDRITSHHHKVYTSALLPMLICGVKAAFYESASITELISCLHKLIISMAEGEVPMQALDMSLTLLLDDSELVEPVIDSLVELLTESSPMVKISCSHLLEICCKSTNCSTMICSKILPGLAVLANSPQSEVKGSTISAFGSVLEISSEREVMDRVYSELLSLIQHIEKTGDILMLMSMISTFSRIGPNVEPQFREDVVLPHLFKWSRENNQCGDTIRRRDIALKLIDVYCALACCFVSSRILKESFLPGVKALQVDLKELALEGSALIQSMIKDMESKIGEDNSNNSRLGAQSVHTQAIGAAVPPGSPLSPRNSKGMLNKFMEKSAPTKMSSLFSKRK